jgi:hypothetical protein
MATVPPPELLYMFFLDLEEFQFLKGLDLGSVPSASSLTLSLARAYKNTVSPEIYKL